MVVFFTGMFLCFNASPCYSGWCCFGPDEDEEEDKVRLLSKGPSKKETQRATVHQSQQSEETERKDRERKIREERLRRESEHETQLQQEKQREEEARQQQEKTKKEEADRLKRVGEEHRVQLQQEQQREKKELELKLLQKERETEELRLEILKRQREEEQFQIELLQKQQEEERNEKERLEQERENLSNTSASVSLPFKKKEEGEGYELITYGNISLLLPKGLEIVLGKKDGTQQEDGTLIAILPQVCKMRIFPDIGSVTSEGNREMRQLRMDSNQARPSSKKILMNQMSWVYKDMRGKKGQISIDSINSMIKCLQKVVETIPEQGPIPVLMHRKHENGLSRILFEMEKGGVLLLVPDTYEEQRKEEQQKSN